MVPDGIDAVVTPDTVLTITENAPVQLLIMVQCFDQFGTYKNLFAVNAPLRIITGRAAAKQVIVTFAVEIEIVEAPEKFNGTHPVFAVAVPSGLVVLASVVFSHSPAKSDDITIAPFGYPPIDVANVASKGYLAPASPACNLDVMAYRMPFMSSPCGGTPPALRGVNVVDGNPLSIAANPSVTMLPVDTSGIGFFEPVDAKGILILAGNPLLFIIKPQTRKKPPRPMV